MLYGLYQSASGADAQTRRLEVISNNLANVETTSFKRDLALFQVNPQEQNAFHDTPEAALQHPGNISLYGVATNFDDGSLETTGGQFDVAIQGPGFMRVGSDEDALLSRNGKLGLDEKRQLIQLDTGLPLLQSTGLTITFPQEINQVEFSPDGNIYNVQPNGQRVGLGKIHLIEPSNPNMLQKQGDSLYRLLDEQYADADSETRIHHGYLERSTVRPIQEMMALMETSRALEANMNLIQQQEHSLGLLLQSLS